MKSATTLAILLLSGSAIVGACASTDAGSSESNVVEAPDAAERRAIMRAVHEQFLDADLHGQANEVMVRLIQIGDGYAFVDGTVQKVGGGELDWNDSEYADEVADGLFDGPQIGAFLKKVDGAWTVLEHDIGATDVWWWGLWSRYVDVPCELFGLTDSSLDECRADQGITVQATDPEHQAILDSMASGFLASELHGQEAIVVGAEIRIGAGYGFVVGQIEGPGGSEIDWANTDYAADVADGFFDGGHVEALLRQADGGWVVLEHGVGSTDVWWAELAGVYPDAPCCIFGDFACQQ